MAKVIIDAGHGGMDPGAIHEGRMEKNDTLNLALAVGAILKKNGVDVVYTRTDKGFCCWLIRDCAVCWISRSMSKQMWMSGFCGEFSAT